MAWMRRPIAMITAFWCYSVLLFTVEADLLDTPFRVRVVSLVLQCAGLLLTVTGLTVHRAPTVIHVGPARFTMTAEQARGMAERLGEPWSSLVRIREEEERRLLELGILEEARLRRESVNRERDERSTAITDLTNAVGTLRRETIEMIRAKGYTWVGVALLLLGLAAGTFPDAIATSFLSTAQ